MEPIKLIYICSLGHSGSTLLDVMLSQHSKFFGLGEMMFFDEWMEDDLLCSCGQTLEDCEFWPQAKPAGFSGLGAISSPEYGKHSYDLIEGVRRVSGASVLVDSSKSVHRLKVLLADPRFDVRVIHLVRNGLAVVNSLQKSHQRPGTGNTLKTKATSPLKAIVRWVRRNQAIDALQGEVDHFLRVRYEDLCSQTESVMQQISDFANVEFEQDMLHPQASNIHNIGGSRWRFSDRPIEIKLDQKWKAELSPGTRWLFRLIGGKLNQSYGYEK